MLTVIFIMMKLETYDVNIKKDGAFKCQDQKGFRLFLLKGHEVGEWVKERGLHLCPSSDSDPMLKSLCCPFLLFE